MRLDQRGLGLLLANEGYRPTMYRDTGGRPTIGVGHLLHPAEVTSGTITIAGVAVPWANGLTRDQCMALLDQDARWAETDVTAAVHVALSQPQFDALTSFTFNVGPTKLAGSTLLRVLNAGHYDQVPAQMQRWVYDGTTKEAGLVARRARESACWSA